MQKTSSLPLILGVACLFSTASLPAAVIVSQSATAPTANILASAAAIADSGLNWNGFAGSASAHRDVAQTFSITDEWNIDAVTFHVRSFGSEAQGAAMTLNILQIPLTSTSPADGAVYSTHAGQLPATLTAGQYITFAFSEAVLLEEGYHYAFNLHFNERGGATGSSTRRTMILSYGDYTSASNPLGSGMSATYANDPFTNYLNTNVPFVTYLSGTAAIPEPSSMLLGTAGLALLAWQGRRRA